MKKKHAIFLVSLAASLIVGCATVKGTLMGAGIGYVLGDAEYGAAVGATAGLIRDIWN
jgi:predicted small secreted protein